MDPPAVTLVSSSDAFWLRAETPTTPSHWAAALEIESGGDRAPVDLGSLRTHVVERLRTIPWASWRIHQPRLLGRHRWLETSPLPVDRLVTAYSSSDDDIESVVARIVMESFDPALPLWRIRLVDLPGRHFVVLDAHHAFAGGYVGVELLGRFFGRAARPPAGVVGPQPTRVPLRLRLADAAWDMAAAVYRRAARMRPAARWTPARIGAPLVGPIGTARRIGLEVVPLARVEAIGAAYGASTTRVLTALLARALDPLGGPEPALRALFPHGTQEGAVMRPGNAARPTYLDLPIGLPPEERLAAVREAIVRGSAGSDGFAVADVTLSFLPTVPDLCLGDRALTSLALAGPLRVCSHPFTRLTVVVSRYAGDVSFTITADDAGMGDEVMGICERLRAAVAEFEGESLLVT